jgi:hypothetical protein
MRQIIAVLMLAGMLGGLASFGPMPRASAQVGNEGAITMGPTVQGEVTQKFTPERGGTYRIAVNGEPMEVPLNLYDHVDVGTVVQFDGTNWSIISGGF